MKFVTYSASGTNARPGLLTEAGILPLPFDSMLELARKGWTPSATHHAKTCSR